MKKLIIVLSGLVMSMPAQGARCRRASPSVSFSPASISAVAGTSAFYTVSVTNRDGLNCRTATFSLQPALPTGFASVLSVSSLAIAPGKSAAVSMKVTSPASALTGNYTVSLAAVNAANSNYRGTASAVLSLSADSTTSTTATPPPPTPIPATPPPATPTPAPTTSTAPMGVDFNAPVVRTWTEDATRTYFNSSLQLNWEHNLGDWVDANGVSQGTTPFASKAVIDTDARQVIEIDVTSYVMKYGADFRINRSGGTNFIFNSREALDPADRPALLVTKFGITNTLSASADTTMDGSTVTALGSSATLQSMYGFMIRFPQPADALVERAILRLVATSAQFGNQTLLVMKPDPHPVLQNAPVMTLGSSSDIILSLQGSALYNSLSTEDKGRAMLAGDGTIQGAIPTGIDTGLNTYWKIPAASRSTETFARFVMKLPLSYDPNWSGKMPGISNTGIADNRATQCAWGGRLADGTCWSARTFFNSTPLAQPFGMQYLNFGAYAYRVNHVTLNGEGPSFNYPIHRGEYFVLDQRVKLNSINADGTANADGEMTYWINGVVVLHWNGIIWRSNNSPESLPSEVWGNIYVGGVGYQAPHPHGYAFHSITASKRLLPFDPNLLKTLNGF